MDLKCDDHGSCATVWCVDVGVKSICQASSWVKCFTNIIIIIIIITVSFTWREAHHSCSHASQQFPSHHTHTHTHTHSTLAHSIHTPIHPCDRNRVHILSRPVRLCAANPKPTPQHIYQDQMTKQHMQQQQQQQLQHHPQHQPFMAMGMMHGVSRLSFVLFFFFNLYFYLLSFLHSSNFYVS